MTVVNPKSISGINSITTGSGSDNLLTIHTSDASSTERVRINSSGDVIVGSGITVSPDGNIFATGVTTSTTFVGALTGAASQVTATANGDNTSYRVPFTSAASGSASIYTDTSDGMTYNPSSGALTINGVFTSGSVSSGAISGSTGTFSSHVSLGDGDELRIGDGSDLKLYHTAGTANYIQASGGHANIHISNLHQLKNQANDEFMLTATNGGSVELYHNNSNKLQTSSSGVTVTGAQTITGGGSDNLKIDMTGANDPYINFREGSTNKCFLQWDSSNDDLRIYNYDSVADLRIGDGGIKFQGDTAAANALDDYEEGSWNVTSFNYDYDGNQAQRGHYVKIGRIVHATFRLKFHNQSTYTGQHMRFTALPFTAANGNPYDVGVSGFAHGYGSIDFFRIYVQPGSTYAYWYTSTGSSFNNSTSLNSADVRGCITYTASS